MMDEEPQDQFNPWPAALGPRPEGRYLGQAGGIPIFEVDHIPADNDK